MKIISSFNKTGIEADEWRKEIAAASNGVNEFLSFDHTRYIDPSRCLDSWSLDRLYRNREPGLLHLYRDLEEFIRQAGADALVVNHCPPYHPDFLRTLPIYRVLYSSDDPDSTYKRNIPYLHAYHHVLFADPAYSAAATMQEKMRQCGMVNADWCPLGVMDFEMDASVGEADLFSHPRDIDILYVGSFFRQKLDLLSRVKKAFGRAAVIRGMFKAKHNLYFLTRHGYPGWVRPVSFAERTRLYQRAKIGFNIHWDHYGLGNQRLYILPANGVLQLTDCADSVGDVFEVGAELDTYRNADDLIAKLEFYRGNPAVRETIARAGYRRTMREYRFRTIMHRVAGLIDEGMRRLGWQHKAASASRS